MQQHHGFIVIATATLLGSALAPLAARAAEYADVVSATPVTVAVATPRQVCRNEAQIVQPGPSGAGAVIGAIAGAVLGHNVGADDLMTDVGEVSAGRQPDVSRSDDRDPAHAPTLTRSSSETRRGRDSR